MDKNNEMNSLNKICWFCFENHDNLLEIYGKLGTDLNVGTILQEHFWFEVGTFAEKNICENCWKKVESFHIFYNFVKSIHQQQPFETKAVFDSGLVYSIKEEPIDIKEGFDVFRDFLDTTNSPASSDGWMEVDSDTTKGPAAIARDVRSSKSTILTHFDSADSPIPRSHELEVDTCTTKGPATGAHKKTRKYTRKSSLPLVNKADHTSLISQYFNMACDRCDTLLSSWRETRKHYRDVHGIEKGYLICCKRKYINLKHMLSHCEWHVNPDAFKCDQCSTTYRDKDKLIKHFKHAHSEKLFNCNDCNQKFSRLQELERHQREHSAFQCPICQKCFTVKIGLRHHIRDNHPPEYEQQFRGNMKSLRRVDLIKEEAKQFECDTCGSRFLLASHLRNHTKKVHNPDNVQHHICEICAKPFSSGPAYKLHYMNTHTNELTKAQCDICGKWFKNRDRIYRHMRHHYNKAATCKACGRVYRSQNSLREHIRRVHLQATLSECVVCGKKLKDKQLLKEHMAIHAGITDLYTCTFCPKTFRSKANMYSHRKRAHPAEFARFKKLQEIQNAS